MNLKTLPIGTLVVALPVAHLIVAGLWLWGWTTGYGARIAMFADARDVFSLSVSDLMVIYLGAMLFPLAFIRTARRPTPAKEKVIAGETEVDRIERLLKSSRAELRRLNRVMGLSGWALLLAGIGTVVWIVDKVHRGEPVGPELAFTPLIILGLVALRVIKVGNPGDFQVKVGLVVIALAFNAVTSGVSSGQKARHAEYTEVVKQTVSCRAGAVMRRLGEHFVVIQPNGRQIVTDLECEPLMTIRPAAPAARRELHWEPYPHVHYVKIGGPPAEHP